MTIYSIIPARGGSKGVPQKNIRLLSGFPLIAYSIIASRLSKIVQRTIVSTDSPEIAKIALKYGAEVPFLRPANLAKDKSADLGYFTHAVGWFEKNEGRAPDLWVQLRPTTPLRETEVIDAAIDKIVENQKATSLRSAHQLAEPPQKMFQIGKNGFWAGFFPSEPRPEYYNLPRQTFPAAYHPNGYVDVVKSYYINSGKGLYGPKMLGFVTPVSRETDTIEDFNFLEWLIKTRGDPIYDYLKKKFPRKK